MAPLSVPARIQALREELMGSTTQVCMGRAELVTQTYRQTEGEHIAIRRAKALKNVLEHLPIFIRDGELLVGQRNERLAGRAVNPEYRIEGQGFTQEQLSEDINLAYWQGRKIRDLTLLRNPRALLDAEEELACGYPMGEYNSFGHVIVDYEKLLKRGLRGIREEMLGYLASSRPPDQEARAFYEGVLISLEAVINWAHRYADLALQLAASEWNPLRQKELLEIARVCRRVPEYPAEGFREALQSLVLIHLALHIEQDGGSISYGRFDQYMYPFLRADLEGDRLDNEAAWELLLSFWVKTMENVDSAVGNTLHQNLTLGGRDERGANQSNELSVMCLDAAQAMQFNQPVLSVRWHPDIDPLFMKKAVETVASGVGMPAFFNDELIIGTLISQGVRSEHAHNYGIVGCVEINIPGMQMGATAGGHLNMAKALELALNQGVSTITGKRIGALTKDPAEFEGMEDLWDAYRTQIEYLCALNTLCTAITGEVQKAHGQCPLMSSLLCDCLERGRDLAYGVHYNMHGVSIYGPSNVYDAFSAIEKWVVIGKHYTFGELRDALNANFVGYEEMRHRLAEQSDRFGNDIESVDSLANRINAIHVGYLNKQVDPRGGRYLCGVWPVIAHVQAGHLTGATPDGRKAGQPLVDGVGACQGADKDGPTALLNSVARLNNREHWPAGNTCNIRFDKTILVPSQLGNIVALISHFMKSGGQQLQINILDSETLRDAQAHPERYRNLLVRVAGFSAYFTKLGKDVQQEIISRSEHSL